MFISNVYFVTGSERTSISTLVIAFKLGYNMGKVKSHFSIILTLAVKKESVSDH